MSAICRNKALCVVVSVWIKCTMARNSVADMVMEASDVGGVVGGIGGIAGGSVEVALGIGGVVGAGGIDSLGSSSCCSACGGIGDADLGGVATGAE